MFSLIKFHNNKFFVIQSRNVQKLTEKTCVVKYSGGKYAAFLISQNDDKSELLDQKVKREQVSSTSKSNIKSTLNLNSSSTPNIHLKTNNASHNTTLSQKPLNISTHKKHSNEVQNNARRSKRNVIKSEEKKLNEIANYKIDELAESKLNEYNSKSPDVNFNEPPICDSDVNFMSDTTLPIATCSSNTNIHIDNTKRLILPLDTTNKSNEISGNISRFSSTAKNTTNRITSICDDIKSSHIHSTALSNNNLKSKTFIDLNSMLDYKIPASEHTSEVSINQEEIANMIAVSDTVKQRIVPYSDSESSLMSDNFSPVKNSPCNNINYGYIKTSTLLSDSTNITSDNSFINDITSSIKISYSNTNCCNSKILTLPSDLINKSNVTSPNSSEPVSTRKNITGTKILGDAEYRQSETSSNTNINSGNGQTTKLVEEATAKYDKISEDSLNSRSFNDISSVPYEDSSNVSEYIPDISSSTCIEIEKSKDTVDHEESINLINDPLNVKNIIIPYSKTKAKKHFCIFCKKLQCTIGRHLLLKHKEKEEVKKALTLPKKSKERLQIIATLRKRGDFEHNTSSKHNTGVLIVSRRQQSKFKNVADDYVCCTKCKGFFSKRTIRIHNSNCKKPKSKKSSMIESRRLTQYMHSAASTVLRTKIFPVLRNDDVTRAIRYDELAIKFGNKLAEKYSPMHQHDMIRANLRLLGRFIIEIKKLDSDIKELKEIFKPDHFDKCVIALRKVASWDETNQCFDAPAVAQNMTSLIKKCGKKQRTELIKERREDLKLELNDFLLLWDEDTPTQINKKAAEDQCNRKRIKKVNLPVTDDIKKLYAHLKQKILHDIEVLSEIFCITNWTSLVQATLVLIQIFNRKRAGEIERLTIENFSNKEIITDSIDKNILRNYSIKSVNFAKQFVRISLRGKLGRTVSVLLCPMCVKAIDIIMKFRADAEISTDNKYIFGRPTNSTLAKPYYRACPLLKMFSEECGAKNPESLRGTTLRKHIATYMSMLNVEEASVERLANFMGHHKDIHKEIYRMSIPVAEIACVSKLLTVAVGNEVGDTEVEDVIIENETECSDSEAENNSQDATFLETSKNSSSSSRKRRSTSPFGKTKRSRWSNNETKAIESIFGNLKSLQNLPSLKECLNAIRQSPALAKRTPQQVKSWIDNQRRYKKDKSTDSNEASM